MIILYGLYELSTAVKYYKKKSTAVKENCQGLNPKVVLVILYYERYIRHVLRLHVGVRKIYIN